VLAPSKGWVLAMLAMLGPSGPARGCAWLRSRRPKRRRPCPALCSVTAGGRRDEGRPATTTPKKPCRAGVEQRADGKELNRKAFPISPLCHLKQALKDTQKAVERLKKEKS